MIPKELENKLIWFFMILPGFLSLSLIGHIVDLGELTEFQLIYSCFALTLINLCIALLICWPIWKCIQSKKSQYAIFYTIIIFVAVSIGILFGYASEKDWLLRSLRWLPITKTLDKRSSNRPLVFLMKQNTMGKLDEDGDARPKKVTEAWVKVRMKSGKLYEGHPEFYEIGNEKSELYLSPACEWKKINDTETINTIPGPGIILYETEIESVTLINREESKCIFQFPELVSGKASK